MGQNWFRDYRSPDEPGAPGAEDAGEESRLNKKKVVAAVLAGVALLLLVLLLCLVLLLTTKETQTPAAGHEVKSLRRRNYGNLQRAGIFNPIENPIADVGRCDLEPPNPVGMIRTWNGISRRLGTTIGYRCDRDPDEEQVMMVVCGAEGHWKTIYVKTNSCPELLHSRMCLGDPLPATSKIPFDWDYKKRDVGTKVQYRCSPALDSPVMRVLICTRDYEWRIHSDTSEKCLCGKPIFYGHPLMYDWDGKSLKPGTTVKYTCHTAMGSNHFQTLTCLTNATWVVTKVGSCIYLVDHPLNFTDSVTYCSELGSEIMVIHNEAEKDAVNSLLLDETAFDSTCNHKVFIGIREDLSRQWKTADGTYVSGKSELWFTVDEGREHCAVVQRPGDLKLNNVLCQGLQYCHLCEFGTNAMSPPCVIEGGSCYVANNKSGDFKFANKTCQASGGHLADVTNMVLLDKARKVLTESAATTSNCDGFFVGLRSDKREYVTYNGSQVPYTLFADDSARRMSRHCVVIHEYMKYKWVDEHCTLPTCFLCKITGNPINSFVPGNVKKVPTVAVQKSMDDGEGASLLQRRFRSQLPGYAAVACELGWVTDGFHCFLFNETLVTNEEAQELCLSYYGSLASLANAFERNFIMDYLTSHWNSTEPSVWHVESAGGLPIVSEFNNGFLYADSRKTGLECIAIHLSPTIGWSVIDCNLKAAIICHD